MANLIGKVEDYPSIPEDALILRNMMRRILDTVEGVFETNQVPLPDRRYYVFGRPAEDCEQVVVSFLNAYLGAPGDQATSPNRCTAPRTGVFDISISRKFPAGVNGNPPTPGKIIEAADWAAVDSWVLLQSLSEFDTWGGFGPGLGVIATVLVTEAEGGILTVHMNLTVGIG